MLDLIHFFGGNAAPCEASENPSEKLRGGMRELQFTMEVEPREPCSHSGPTSDLHGGDCAIRQRRITGGGDYVKNQWEQPGTVTQVYASEAGQEQVSIRWDDGGADLPLTPAKEFTLISGHAAQSKNLP